VVSLWWEILHPGFSLLIFAESSPSPIPIEALSGILTEARFAIRPIVIRKPDAVSIQMKGALVLLDPHGVKPLLKCPTVDRIVISKEPVARWVSSFMRGR
jgi:hypothetical protein